MSSEDEKTPPSSRGQHDNYINYDIAQSVVKESRKEKGEERPEAGVLDTWSPLHVKQVPLSRGLRGLRGSLGEEEEESRPTRPSISMSLDEDEEDYPEEVRPAVS